MTLLPLPLDMRAAASTDARGCMEAEAGARRPLWAARDTLLNSAPLASAGWVGGAGPSQLNRIVGQALAVLRKRRVVAEWPIVRVRGRAYVLAHEILLVQHSDAVVHIALCVLNQRLRGRETPLVVNDKFVLERAYG
eukprot:CAMPEP_0119417466 /NCGR_PEP_ID=MMETSP1335-20130426/15882_1 /TAXON_ID=259385 /ORGANISM="Chrysoculter rhomboideus, Strain RCC1486" /LENGTH=136 /DNA_ID=CAMNT_0007442647 /DNA_START=548 /DNA_END=960 /DNA_ORIENTATION=-